MLTPQPLEHQDATGRPPSEENASQVGPPSLETFTLAMRLEQLLLAKPADGLDADAERRLIATLESLSQTRLVVSPERGMLARLGQSEPRLPHALLKPT